MMTRTKGNKINVANKDNIVDDWNQQVGDDDVMVEQVGKDQQEAKFVPNEGQELKMRRWRRMCQCDERGVQTSGLGAKGAG